MSNLNTLFIAYIKIIDKSRVRSNRMSIGINFLKANYAFIYFFITYFIILFRS